MKSFKLPVSVEFFPPKTEEGARQILKTANAIKDFKLDFVSITYGAGGSTRERTIEYGELLKEIFNFEVMPHLTCVGHSVSELKDMLKSLKNRGFTRIMALRGDPPKDSTTFTPHPDGLKYANELVSLIKKECPQTKIACAGYPEKHPEAPSLEADIDNLKRKIDCGAELIVTQLFFENANFYKFVELCRSKGINVPIVAGIMPALSLKQVQNFSNFCGCQIPTDLKFALSCARNEEEELQQGLIWAKAQIQDLHQHKVDGLHLYILNRAGAALSLLDTI